MSGEQPTWPRAEDGRPHVIGRFLRGKKRCKLVRPTSAVGSAAMYQCINWRFSEKSISSCVFFLCFLCIANNSIEQGKISIHSNFSKNIQISFSRFSSVLSITHLGSCERRVFFLRKRGAAIQKMFRANE